MNILKNTFIKEQIIESLKQDKEKIIELEIEILNNLYNKFKLLLKEENFSGKNGRLIYKFDNSHKKDIFVSPEVYLTEDNTIVYEIYDIEKYIKVTNNPNNIYQNGNYYYCKVPLSYMLNYISLIDIIDFIIKYLEK